MLLFLFNPSETQVLLYANHTLDFFYPFLHIARFHLEELKNVSVMKPITFRSETHLPCLMSLRCLCYLDDPNLPTCYFVRISFNGMYVNNPIRSRHSGKFSFHYSFFGVVVFLLVRTKHVHQYAWNLSVTFSGLNVSHLWGG